MRKFDGRYGKKTEDAVQATVNLPVTGKADLATKFMLVFNNNSLIHNGDVYTAQKHNYVIIFW